MIHRWLKLPKTQKSCLIIGSRRAGKTTFLKQQIPHAPYMTMDDFDIRQTALQNPKKLFEDLDVKEIVVDEVQRVPPFLIAIKDRIDNYGQKFWMTGSSTVGLLSKGAETLAGRMKILECPTLCWGEEMGESLGKSFEKKVAHLHILEAERKLDDWLKFGGFPEVRTQKTAKEKMEVLKDYKNTYFTKDLLMMSNIENADGMMACMHYLAQCLGNRTNIEAVSKESGLNYHTAKKYVNVLEASRLVFSLSGYQFGDVKRQRRSKKYYFTDVSIPTAIGSEVSQGHRFELFVASELEKRRKLGRFDCEQFYYYETEGGRETDLVIDEGKRVTIIEIKNTKNPDHKDVTNLKNFKLSKKGAKLRKILISRSTEFGKMGDVELWPVFALYQYI